MKPLTKNKLLNFSAGIALGVALSLPAVADDTEVLTGNRLDPGRPNITFIIDTSGSMASDVVISEDYNPDETYSGTCQLDRFYWTQEGTGTSKLPPCDTNRYVNKDAFLCQTGLQAMDQVGRYRDRFVQFDTSLSPQSWVRVRTSSDVDQTNGAARLTECLADSGIHGETVGEFYAADGAAGPWSTNMADEIDWQSLENTYTFYSGNYLNWIADSGQETKVSSRMEVVQNVANDVLASLSGVNVALMRFSANAEGGMVINEMVPVEQGLSSLMTAVDSLRPLGPTPITETMYEARQYFVGGNVKYGVNSESAPDIAQPSVDESQDASGNYISPITRQCQRNYLVLLTDGLPTDDTSANSDIEDLPGFSGDCDGSCLDELTRYINTQDQIPDNNLEESQTIQTFTIGFNTDQDLLLNAATGRVPQLDANGERELDADGEVVTRPGYFVANDPDQLAQAFDDILSAIRSDGEIFSAPSLTVDIQNRLTNREDLYF
ncbi:MAG: hypothetical protein KJO35_07070, partial [Gammaproteobacteria bacterium]|nr:hypothetical protein [Gammaproteobacteria bacterium]